MLPSRSGVQPKHLNTILYIWPSLFRDHQTVAIKIHCCYCLMSSGILEREDRIYCTGRQIQHLSFFLVKMFKLYLFIMKLNARVRIFTKIICIEKMDVFLKKADFNIYIQIYLSELLSICVLICRNLRCPQKFLATRLCTGAIF